MRSPLAALTSRDTYRDLLFLATAVPFGTAWVGALTVGWALAVATAVTPLVVPVVIGLGVLADLAARAEIGTARQLLGVPLHPAVHRGGLGAGLRSLARARAVVRDPAFWKAQAYLVLRFLVGVPVAAVASCLAFGLFLVTSPVHYRWLPQGDGGHGVDLGIWQADTLPETLLLVPVGLVLLVVTASLVRPLTAPWRRLTYLLLGGTMIEDHLPLTDAQLRRGVAIHGIVVGGVSALLVTIWALTTRAYFWPMWPVLVLGLPLAIHAWTVLVLTRPQMVPPRLGRGLAVHAGVSAALATFLTLIWTIVVATEDGFGYFWPVWPILGLAVPVLVHLVVKLMAPGADADLQRRIDVLTTTRAGAVDAQEEELRRIERDLHDGAQARLVALGMNLGMAEQKLATDPDRVRQLLAEAREGTREALEELRDLARGIHPPILGDRGLGAAVSALAARSPLPVTVSVEGERPPSAVESAAYFVAAEAIANAGKHAGADHVDVRIARREGRLVVEIVDDGRGGADPSGTGLRGLRRRVEALDGTLQVVSPEGGPTTVRAELPCE